MMRSVFGMGLAALVLASTGCAGMRAAMLREARSTAARDLGCGMPRVDALEDWAFRAESACGSVVFYRCGLDQHMTRPLRPQPHFDCHPHSTADEVVGLFHPANEPDHVWR